MSTDVAFPSPGASFDPRNEAEFRRTLEQAFRNLTESADFAGGYASLALDDDGQVIILIGTTSEDTSYAWYRLDYDDPGEPHVGDYIEPVPDDGESIKVLETAMPYTSASGVTLASGESAYLWVKFYPTSGVPQGEVKVQITNNKPPNPPSLVIESETESTADGLTIEGDENIYDGHVGCDSPACYGSFTQIRDAPVGDPYLNVDDDDNIINGVSSRGRR